MGLFDCRKQREEGIQASEEENLIHKRETFRKETGTSKAIHLTMITMEELQNSEYRNTIINEITGNDLFRKLTSQTRGL